MCISFAFTFTFSFLFICWNPCKGKPIVPYYIYGCSEQRVNKFPFPLQIVYFKCESAVGKRVRLLALSFSIPFSCSLTPFHAFISFVFCLSISFRVGFHGFATCACVHVFFYLLYFFGFVIVVLVFIYICRVQAGFHWRSHIYA